MMNSECGIIAMLVASHKSRTNTMNVKDSIHNRELSLFYCRM